MEYLVSVVVPTKNRYRYLKYLIQLINSFQLPELELVIQDNSDDNTEIIEYLKEFDNPNIKYYHSLDSLTMSGNAERGIMNASGEYVCYIGDDDGVCRNIVECVKWMKNHQIEIAVSRSAWFVWGGLIRVYDRNREILEILDTDAQRKVLARRGMELDKTMPNIYHSIVRKQLLVRLYEEYNTLFPSVPPDISGSLMISYAVPKYVKFNFPVVIVGSSAMTGGGVKKRGGVLPLEEVPFISQKDIDEWERDIPPIWSGSYAWLNSAVKTLRVLNQEELIKEIRYEYAFAGAVVERPYRKDLWRFSYSYSKSKLAFIVALISLYARKTYNRFINKYSSRTLRSSGKANIIEAEQYFKEELENKQIKKKMQSV